MSTAPVQWSLRREDFISSSTNLSITNVPDVACFMCANFQPKEDRWTQYWDKDQILENTGQCVKALDPTPVRALQNCRDFALHHAHMEKSPVHRHLMQRERIRHINDLDAKIYGLQREVKAAKAKATELRKRIIEINAKNRKKADAKAGL